MFRRALLPLALFLLALPLHAQIIWEEHVIGNSFDAAHTAVAFDIDNDGDLDVVAAAVGADDIAWWENDGEMNWEMDTVEGSFDGARSVHCADINQDGYIDIVGGAQMDDTVMWWDNDGTGFFGWVGHPIDQAFDGVKSVYAVDFDQDGDIDVIGAAAGSLDDYIGEVAWWENDGQQQWTKHTIDDTINGAHRVYTVDMDDDGDLDVIACARDSDEIVWYENNGMMQFIEHQIASGFLGARSIYPVDLDQDGDIDVIGCGQYQDEAAWWENDGNENFTKHTIDDDMDGARDVFAGDMDLDGDIDVLCAEYIPGRMVYFENDGEENFTLHWIDENWHGARGIRAVDLDLDGDLDVLGASGFADSITWWENTNTVGVDPADTPSVPDPTLPRDIEIVRVHPNPFNRQVSVDVELARPGSLTLRVFDLLGRQVMNVRDPQASPGRRTFSLSSSGLASGMYILNASLDGEAVHARTIVHLK